MICWIITRITHGKLLLNMGLVDAHALFKRGGGDIVRSDLEQKQIALTMELGLSCRRSKAMRHAATSILERAQNAAKFTPEAGAYG